MLENSPIAAVLAFFIVLIPLILIHELGHFLAAKAVGITILEFGLGFPPRIRRLFTWRGTEFTLNWIPLGGFVRPLGEDMIRPLDDEAVEKDRQELLERQQNEVIDHENARNLGTHQPKSINEARPLGRIFFMAAGAIANFILAFLLFAIIAILGVPQSVGTGLVIADIASDSVFELAGIKNGDVILSVDGQRFADTTDFLDRYYMAEGSARITIQRSESSSVEEISVPVINRVENSVANYSQIRVVVNDTPASQAGMQPGDIVTRFNGEIIDGIEAFRMLTRDNAGQEVVLTIQRDNEIIEVRLIPRVNPPEGQGSMGIVIGEVQQDQALGITYSPFDQIDYVSMPLGESLRYGVDRVVEVITTTIRIPGELISGVLSPQEARPVSVVGMSQIGAVILQQSIEQERISPILEFIATISVALGFFNLLPIPALDGGRIVFVLIEIIRGKPIAPEREGLVHLVGLALLLSLSVLVMLNDVINPIMDSLR